MPYRSCGVCRRSRRSCPSDGAAAATTAAARTSHWRTDESHRTLNRTTLVVLARVCGGSALPDALDVAVHVAVHRTRAAAGTGACAVADAARGVRLRNTP